MTDVFVELIRSHVSGQRHQRLYFRFLKKVIMAFPDPARKNWPLINKIPSKLPSIDIFHHVPS